MKTYSKLIILVIIALLATSLFGCAAQPTATTAPTEPQAQPTAVEVQPTTPPKPTAVPPTEVVPTEAPQQVTLTYAAWNLGTEEENNQFRQLVKAYTDLHPNITIEFVDMSGEGGWEANLTAYAAKGELPDVFMANNIPLYVQNGWMADVSDLVKDDPDWADIPQVLKDSFEYSGAVLGIPSGIFVMGYFVNQDLYEAANLDAPTYGISVDDWEKAVTGLNNVEKGILGLDETVNVTGWVANALNPTYKYYSYDGSKLNYNSTEFKTAIQKTIDMKPYTWQGLSDEQKANFKSTGPWELFLNQEVGMRWDASWALGSYVSSATFNWDFIGTPGGNQAVVFDALGVSKTTANLQEAFNFAKWMSFSKEGYAKEAEIAKALNGAPSRMPVSIDADSIALFKTFFDKPGVNMALENLDNSMIESMAKIVPGYIQARWEGKPGIDIGDNKDVTIGWMFDNVITGQFKYEDYSAKLEEFANKILTEAAALVNK